MPIIKSARKRVRVARKATTRNVKTKRNLKTAVKSLTTALKGKDKKAAEAFQKAQSTIDQAAKKNVIHKNRAARKKSQLAKAAKAAGVPVNGAGAKKSTPKAAAKPATKKAPTKKAAPKKTASKPKAAAKKTTKK